VDALCIVCVSRTIGRQTDKSHCASRKSGKQFATKGRIHSGNAPFFRVNSSPFGLWLPEELSAEVDARRKPGSAEEAEEILTEAIRSTRPAIGPPVNILKEEARCIWQKWPSCGRCSINGRVKPVDGEAFSQSLRQREDELLKQRTAK
jgi:hypothetical protein